MPCNDWGSGPGPVYIHDHESARKLKEVEAMLCGLLTSIESSESSTYNLNLLLMSFDEKESGVDKSELLKWWQNHKAEDAARKLKEQKIKEKQELKKQALSKLTDKEKKALGL